MRRLRWILLFSTFTGVVVYWSLRPVRAQGLLRQDVYVWQRSWNDGVKASVQSHGHEFSSLVALGAQVWWKQGRPQVARVAIDWDSVRQSGARVGLAIRINEFRGPFDRDGDVTRLLVDLAAEMLAQGSAAGVPVEELQIDFDAAESKLDGYRVWVEAISQRVAPAKVVITALPSWLDASAFPALASAGGEYILQVHSVQRPRAGEPMTLCDSIAARAAVERAGRIGVPFRVALPTYGHAAAFDRAGRLVGISAEGRRDAWDPAVIVQHLHAEPAQLAGLIREWSHDRPAAMRGVIWYRLPVADDVLNWRWPTLSAVMNGRTPASRLHVEQKQENDVVMLELVNSGEADEPLDMPIDARGLFEAFDGFSGFSGSYSDNGVRFAGPGRDQRIGAGDRMPVGWLRPRNAREVVVDVQR